MRKFNLLFVFATAFFLIGIISINFTGCEGPMGPEGLMGPQGLQGEQGLLGPTGGEGTAGCIECHNDKTTVLAKIIQAENSVHSTGGNFKRSANNCAPCHTHEGFVEILTTGEDTTLYDIIFIFSLPEII